MLFVMVENDIIINKYDVIMMSSVNLYNSYSEEKFKLLDRLRFNKYLSRDQNAQLVLLISMYRIKNVTAVHVSEGCSTYFVSLFLCIC